MTNLEIIKYLANNNPARLAELLDDIYCNAWNCGSYAGSNGEGKILEECEMEFSESKWLDQEANTSFFFDHELEEWHRAIHPTYTIIFENGKLECKDGKFSMHRNDHIDNIEQAIDEIQLLENIIDSEKIPQSAYDNFRRNVCAYCSDQQNCLRSEMDIFECLKDENWEDWV